LYGLTLLFSDDNELWLLGYVTGLLALLAVFRFGGLATAIGFLVTVFAARYYFVPLAVKAIEGRSLWHNLYSPTETLSVLAWSLLAMVLASVLLRENESTNEVFRTLSELMHLSRLIIVTALIGGAATLQATMTQQHGSSAEYYTGFLGAFGDIFTGFLAFSLSLSLYRAIILGKNPMRSNAVILLLALNALFAVISTSRASVLIILVAVAVPYAFARRRIPAPLIACALIGLCLFVFVLSPAIVYFRSGELEFYSFDQRVSNFAEFWADTLSNPGSVIEYREVVSAQGHYLIYFDNYYSGLERFAILPTSDRLVNGTTITNHYGGWRTILWAVEMVPPRFVYPDKPILGPGAYLGQVAGLTHGYDTTTQWAVGFPAEFYHAFSYLGVFLGTVAVLGLLILALQLFRLFGVDPAWNMVIVINYWNSFSEATLASLLSTLVPLVIFVLAVDRVVRHIRR
jgi:hypothetical protein